MHVLKISQCFLFFQIIFHLQTSLIPATTPQAQTASSTQPIGLTPGNIQALQDLPPELQALLVPPAANIGKQSTAPVSSNKPTPASVSQPVSSVQLPLAPIPTNQVTSSVQQALTLAPASSQASSLEQKLATYKQQIAGINSKTPHQQQQQIITGFITEIIEPALASKQTDLVIFKDIQQVCTTAIHAITTQISALSNKKDDLDRKVAQLAKVTDLFAAARKIPLDKLQEKVAEYLLLLAQITPELPDTYAQDFIKDLNALVIAAHGQEPAKIALVQNLLDKTALNQTFKEQALVLQIKGLVGILTGQTTTKPTATTIVSPDELKTQLANSQKQATLFQKIASCQTALGLISNTTTQADKNALISMLSGFMSSLSTMTKADLAALQALFDAASKNPFLLAANQQIVMGRWLKIVTQALLTIDNSNTLLACVKTALDSSKDPYTPQLDTCNLAIVLATYPVPPNELQINAQNKTSLAAKIQAKLFYLYTNRGNKSYQELTTLQSIFSLARLVSALANIITPEWYNTLTLDLALSSAATKTSVIDQMPYFQTITQQLSSKTDPYEKQTFLARLNNIFFSRATRADTELKDFNTVLSTLTAPAFVSKKIFNTSQNTQIQTWQKILTCTLQLLTPHTQLSLQNSINLYQPMLPVIALPDATYEKTLFGKILTQLFNLRSGLQSSDLLLLKNFFTMVQNTPNLLAANQKDAFNTWVKTLETTRGK